MPGFCALPAFPAAGAIISADANHYWRAGRSPSGVRASCRRWRVHAPDYVSHQHHDFVAAGALRGREAVRQFVAEVRNAVPDDRDTIDDQIAERDRVVTGSRLAASARRPSSASLRLTGSSSGPTPPSTARLTAGSSRAGRTGTGPACSSNWTPRPCLQAWRKYRSDHPSTSRPGATRRLLPCNLYSELAPPWPVNRHAGSGLPSRTPRARSTCRWRSGARPANMRKA